MKREDIIKLAIEAGFSLDNAWFNIKAIEKLLSMNTAEKELANTAMKFVDRAGDVHPGIDDAETICEEFSKAMGKVLDKWYTMPRHKEI